MWGPAFEAAEFAIAEAERRVDERIGISARKTLGRYLCAATLGIPTAYIAGGMRWNALTWAGFALGMALFALLDTLRAIWRDRRAGSARVSAHRDDAGALPPRDAGNAS